jgi:NDP-sugar pyrophosphorylase family protein
MDAVLLAGGKGTRLAPYNTNFPKPLVPMGDKPIIDLIIRQLDHYGFKRIVLSLGYLGELIEAYLNVADLNLKNARLEIVREKSPMGTVGSLSLVSGLEEPFLVVNGDTLTTLDYRKFMEFHVHNKGTITVAANKKNVTIDLGVLSVNGDNQIMSFQEKPTLKYLVSMGVYAYDPVILKAIKPGIPLDFPQLLWDMLDKKERVLAYQTEDYWVDLGTHSDYGRAQEEFDVMRSKLLPFE